MSEFFKAELKDKFLRYASEREDYFETRLLYDEYLRPNYSLAYVERLIKEIIDFVRHGLLHPEDVQQPALLPPILLPVS